MKQNVATNIVAGAALAALLTIGMGSPAQAERGRYCAHFYWIAMDCAYYTAQQCFAAVDGVGGHCTVGFGGPVIFGYAGELVPPRARRHKRRYRY